MAINSDSHKVLTPEQTFIPIHTLNYTWTDLQYHCSKKKCCKKYKKPGKKRCKKCPDKN